MKRRIGLFISIFTLLLCTTLPSLFSNVIDTSYKQVNALSQFDIVDSEIIPNPGATYETQRIWLSHNIDNEYDNYVYYQYNDNSCVIKMESIINVYDSSTYYYVDVPYQVTSIHFLKMFTTTDDYIINRDINIDYLTYGSCYIYDSNSTGAITTNVNGADATLLSLVVEAYLTYGKDNSNGCTESTIKNLFNTWFRNKSASSDDLKNTKILDYTGYAANGNSYEGLVKNAYFSINEKWNTMCSQVGIDPNTGETRGIDWSWLQSRTFKMILIIGGTSLVVIGGVVVLLIVRKRRRQDY